MRRIRSRTWASVQATGSRTTRTPAFSSRIRLRSGAASSVVSSRSGLSASTPSNGRARRYPTLGSRPTASG